MASVIVPLIISAAGEGTFLAAVAASKVAMALVTVGAAVVDSLYIMPRLFRNEGPEPQRLEDLEVQHSQEGSPANILFGQKIRIAGTVIWAPRLREWEYQHSGGKGGSAGEYSEMVYYAHTAIRFARVPEGLTVSRVLKIYANGKVLWNAEPDIDYSSTKISARIELRRYWDGFAQDYKNGHHLVLECDLDDDLDVDLSIAKGGRKMQVSGFTDESHPLAGHLVLDGNHNSNEPRLDINSDTAGTLYVGDTLGIVGDGTTYYVQREVVWSGSGTETVHISPSTQQSNNDGTAVLPYSHASNNNGTWQVEASGRDDATNKTWVRTTRHMGIEPAPGGKAYGDTVEVFQELPTHSLKTVSDIRVYLGSTS